LKEETKDQTDEIPSSFHPDESWGVVWMKIPKGVLGREVIRITFGISGG
jgi:hypothetical protein